jgi:putative oxidoreductase
MDAARPERTAHHHGADDHPARHGQDPCFPAVASFANLSPFSLIGAAGLIELIGGALLILGLLTRPVAFIISGEMAFAYFMAHAPKDFYPLINGGTLAIMFCFTCLFLSTAGAGPWSVDAAMKRG